MNSTSLKKPVDLQGLSLALAKTKADYEGQINNLYDNIPQSDWDITDEIDKSYILNKPAIVAGEGENAVMIGQIEQDEEARMYNISFDYPTTATDTITFTTSDDLSDIANLSAANKKYLVCNLEYDITYSNGNTSHSNNYYTVTDIDVANSIITISKALPYYSTNTYSSVSGIIYYKSKISNKTNSVAEGKATVAVGIDSHAEGLATKALGSYSHAEGCFTVASSNNSHAESYFTVASAGYSHAEGFYTTASGSASHSEGYHTTASGNYSHAEGFYTTASGKNSHASGSYSIASGEIAHAEGYHNTASGRFSHAEGEYSYASGESAHAEGGYTATQVTLNGEANTLTYNIIGNSVRVGDTSRVKSIAVYYNNKSYPVTAITLDNELLESITLETTLNADSAFSGTVTIDLGNTASGVYAHAEGSANHAKGAVSHAEGAMTWALEEGSHTEGKATIASSQYQHVQGKWNIADTNNTYADIVGNGTSSSSRSNAYTLDWSGNGWYAGKVTVGAAPTENMDVATKQYVDENGGITYTISATNNTITLTGSDSSTSTATFPIYDGTILSTWEGGNF